MTLAYLWMTWQKHRWRGSMIFGCYSRQTQSWDLSRRSRRSLWLHKWTPLPEKRPQPPPSPIHRLEPQCKHWHPGNSLHRTTTVAYPKMRFFCKYRKLVWCLLFQSASTVYWNPIQGAGMVVSTNSMSKNEITNKTKPWKADFFFMGCLLCCCATKTTFHHTMYFRRSHVPSEKENRFFLFTLSRDHVRDVNAHARTSNATSDWPEAERPWRVDDKPWNFQIELWKSQTADGQF